MKNIRYCLQCSKEIQLFDSEIKNKRGKFCSKNCCDQYKKENNRCEIICLNCGVVINLPKSREKSAKFCCRKCADEHLGLSKRKGEDKICKTCNKQFHVKPVALKRNGNRGSFCSKKCQSHGKTKKCVKVVKCLFCEKEFEASISRIERGSAKHCSRACADKNRPKRNLQRVKFHCVVCDKEFLVKPSRAKLGNVQFCSKKCNGIQQTLNETEERECQVCKNKFRATKFSLKQGWGKFCSDECRLQKPSTKITKQCENCNKIFLIEPHRNETSKYCSRQCLHIGKRTSVNRKCEKCDRSFMVPPARIKNGGGKFCSDECRKTGRINGKYLYCPTCGSEFYANLARISRNKLCFCSRKCSFEHHTGPNSPSWKGGVTPEHKKIRYSQEYKEWRTAVFERDDYTCQECGHRSGNGKTIPLECHHIKSFVKYPELRFDIKNGLTLCRDCHKKTDSWGKKPHQHE